MKYPKAKIVSFEPLPFCIRQLERFQRRFPELDWEIDRSALADADGTGVLRTNMDDEYSSMATLRTTEPKAHRIDIRLQTLDSALDKHGLAWVDLAKFDCEGGEFPALYGASEAALSKIRALCIEVHKDPTPGYNRADLKRYLQEKGFETANSTESEHADFLYGWRTT